MKTTQAGLARICGVSRSAIWYRVQKGHLRPDENGLLDVTRARRALQRSGSRIIIPYNERELLEIEKLKLQTYKLRIQIGELEGSLVPIKRLEELEADRRMDVFEIFRDHMIEQLYLDLAEEEKTTQRFTENFFRIAKLQRKIFSERKGGMIFNVISEK